jgi:hypothetical protein
MLAATLIAVFIIPVLFVTVERLSRRTSHTTVASVTSPRPVQGGD